MSQIRLPADAVLNAIDARLKPADIGGIATAGETPVAHYLGLTREWVARHRGRGPRDGPPGPPGDSS